MQRNTPGIAAIFRSLSARLLVLTILFVMLGEVLIYVPSIARHRQAYLEQRIASAHQASLVTEAMPPSELLPVLEHGMIRHARVMAIALRRRDASYLLFGEPPPIDASFDLNAVTPAGLARDAFVTLLAGEGRVIRVTGTAPLDAETTVEIILDETVLRREMLAYSWRIFTLSMMLSLISAALVYLSLQWLMVRPMRRIVENLTAFSAAPGDARRVVPISDRQDEIGVLQRELASLQRSVRAMLDQKERLAGVGEAVSKINHDLRNMLQSAVLESDRLVNSSDPAVRRAAPILINAIDRAATLCAKTLDYVRAETPEPGRDWFALLPVVDEVRAGLRPAVNGVDWRIDVAPTLRLLADRDLVHRIIANLARNAAQAMNGSGRLAISARREGEVVQIDVSDSGAGLPPKARENLFKPFAGSARLGGSGLGLPIARDLARAHGGEVRLLRSDATGTTFQVELPSPLT
ncbi:MAG: HAMP domain-containing histidine kinase [Alphaproteobacteria bacterium]|nr:HAMP domain-containing histidine kinase [Alphaproteobacteria bacterium]